MKNKRIIIIVSAFAAGLLLYIFGDGKFLPFLVPIIFTHCDTEDGPVVKAAKKALKTKNVDHVLIWVGPDNEPEIKKAFEKTLIVRKLNPQARELAEKYFFETVVRLHRASEGEPYTGIKPAGTKTDPSIFAADKAIEEESIDNLIEEISTQITDNIRERFNHLLEKKKHKDRSVKAGREYVKAYITFIHSIEKIHHTITGKGTHHEH